jgi:hypothetical protein
MFIASDMLKPVPYSGSRCDSTQRIATQRPAEFRLLRPDGQRRFSVSSPKHKNENDKRADQNEPEYTSSKKWETAAREEYTICLVDIVTSPSPPQEPVCGKLSLA